MDKASSVESHSPRPTRLGVRTHTHTTQAGVDQVVRSETIRNERVGPDRARAARSVKTLPPRTQRKSGWPNFAERPSALCTRRSSSRPASPTLVRFCASIRCRQTGPVWRAEAFTKVGTYHFAHRFSVDHRLLVGRALRRALQRQSQLEQLRSKVYQGPTASPWRRFVMNAAPRCGHLEILVQDHADREAFDHA